MAFADTKHFLGRRISEWVTAAPAMEASVAAANMTQEELGHARSLFAMIRDIPGAPAELNTDTDLTRKKYYNPSFLNQRWKSWIEVVVSFFLIDIALTKIIEGAKNSRLIPLKQRTAKILQEEHFHAIYCRGWISRLSATGNTGKTQINTTLKQVWPVAAAWFGPPDDRSLASLQAAGIFHSDLQESYLRWMNDLRKFLELNELSVPEHQIDWKNWQAIRREVKV